MKKLIYILLVTGIVFASCQKKQKRNEDIIMVKPEKTEMATHVKQLQKSDVTLKINHRGKAYKTRVVRVPDESLDMIPDADGNKYMDNKVTVTLTQGDTEVWHKVFTKQSFASLVGEEFMQKSILEGFVFYKEVPQGFVYAVSVAYPDSDLFVPIEVTIAPDGGVRMVKSDLIDSDAFDELEKTQNQLNENPESV